MSSCENSLLYDCVVIHGATSQSDLPSTSVIRSLDPGHQIDPQLVLGGPAPQSSSTFFCSNAKNDYMAALTPAAPSLPIDPTKS